MRKFKIPSLPPTTSKSVRFPNDIIDDVESAIQGTNCTFSVFVVEEGLEMRWELLDFTQNVKEATIMIDIDSYEIAG